MMAALYTCTDAVSLLTNIGAMAKSTIIHHICVVLSFVWLTFHSFENEGVYKGIIIYGAFSSLAFPVNTYLGCRFLMDKNSIDLHLLTDVALISYILACAANWIWQSYYICILITTYYTNIMELAKVSVYLGLMISWISDDIVLINHLIK